MSEHIGYVSSEGGPFLICDAEEMRGWRGIESSDYEKLCEIMDAADENLLSIVNVRNMRFACWQPGVGTVEVSRDRNSLVFDYGVKIGQNNAYEYIQNIKDEITVYSAVLAVMWAPENGESITEADMQFMSAGVPSGLLAVEGSSLLIPVRNGTYRFKIYNNKLSLDLLELFEAGAESS